MSDGLVLFDDGLVSLRILMHDGGLAAIVEEELCLVEVFLVASDEIELGKSHLGNLVTRHHTSLSGIGSHLAADTVGIADGDVEELTAARGLIVGDGTLYHVTEVVELMAEVLFLAPALLARPLVGLFGVLGARGVEIAVGFLCRGNDIEHGVNICHEFLVGVGLQDIRGTLDGFIGVGIVEGQSAHLEYLRRVFQVLCCIREVGVATRLLALRESKGDGHLTAGLQPLSPEGARGYFHRGKRHRIDRIAVGWCLFLRC